MQRSDSGFCDSKAAATIAQPLEGLEPHHVMRLAISDDDYFQTDYGAGLACGIKQPA
jgi:hypothetical protein